MCVCGREAAAAAAVAGNIQIMRLYSRNLSDLLNAARRERECACVPAYILALPSPSRSSSCFPLYLVLPRSLYYNVYVCVRRGVEVCEPRVLYRAHAAPPSGKGQGERAPSFRIPSARYCSHNYN